MSSRGVKRFAFLSGVLTDGECQLAIRAGSTGLRVAVGLGSISFLSVEENVVLVAICGKGIPLKRYHVARVVFPLRVSKL